jgi:hypothetical protein
MLGDFLAIWQAANPAERQRLLQATFTAVYCDTAEGVVVGVAPRAPFTELFPLCEGLLMPSSTEIEPPERYPRGVVVPGDPEGSRGPSELRHLCLTLRDASCIRRR